MFRFNPEKELDKIQHGGKNRFIVFSFLLLVIAVVGTSYAFYQVRYSKRIIYTRVKINRKDVELAVKIEGETENRKEFPNRNEGLIYSGITCDNEGVTTATWNYGTWSLDLNSSGPNKCTINFRKKTTTTGTLSSLCTGNMALNECMKEHGLEVANTLIDETEDGNLRYVGASDVVNNYVLFNCDNYNSPSVETCELWRIIGLMNNIVDGTARTQSLVKLIRANSIGDLQLDADDYSERNTNLQTYNNDWTTSELMYMLNPGYDTYKAKTTSSASAKLANNSLYWNGAKGNCYMTSGKITTDGCDYSSTGTQRGLKNDETRNMIENVIWNLGGLSDTSSAANNYQNATAAIWYKYERGTDVYTGRQTEWIGKIGLMYPSDYGYATGGKGSGSGTYTREQCLNYQLYRWFNGDYKTDCAKKDWLYDSSKQQWTLTPVSSVSSGVPTVHSDGSVNTNSTWSAYAVRPSLYLTSSVKIKSGEGNGSSDHPYIIVP